jgi:ribosome-associated translation inhibitor RaiA
MPFPVTITFRDIPHTVSADAHIRRKANKLGRLHRHIVACRVLVEAPHHHHQHGNHYQVRVNVALPGGTAVVDPRSDVARTFEDLHAAIECAFDDMARVLTDLGERRRTRADQGTETRAHPFLAWH